LVSNLEMSGFFDESASGGHKSSRRGIHPVRRRRQIRGERSSSEQSEKGPFPDGNQLEKENTKETLHAKFFFQKNAAA